MFGIVILAVYAVLMIGCLLYTSPRDIHVERLLRLAAYEDTGLTPEEATVSRWIPVTERLPEDDATPLICLNPFRSIIIPDTQQSFLLQARLCKNSRYTRLYLSLIHICTTPV